MNIHDQLVNLPLQKHQSTFKPAGPGVIASGLHIGGFRATDGADDLSADPPVYHGGHGAFCAVQAGASGIITLCRLLIEKIGRVGGCHTDGIWECTNPALTNVTLLHEDIWIADIEGGGVQFDGGSGVIAYRRVTIERVGYPNALQVKLLPGCKLQLVLDGCNCDVGLDLTHLAGATPGSVLSDVWVRNHSGRLPVNWGVGVTVHSGKVPDYLEVAPTSAAAVPPASASTMAVAKADWDALMAAKSRLQDYVMWADDLATKVASRPK